VETRFWKVKRSTGRFSMPYGTDLASKWAIPYNIKNFQLGIQPVADCPTKCTIVVPIEHDGLSCNSESKGLALNYNKLCIASIASNSLGSARRSRARPPFNLNLPLSKKGHCSPYMPALKTGARLAISAEMLETEG
jgi:hypothetical protein